MAETCKRRRTLREGPHRIVATVDAKDDAFDRAEAAATTWARNKLAIFFGEPCPATCPIILSWDKGIRISVPPGYPIEVGGRWEQALDVFIDAWKVCLPEDFWIPILGYEWRPPNQVKEGKETKVACGPNEWAKTVQEVGPARKSSASAETAAQELVRRRCAEMIQDWYLRTRCGGDCSHKILVPGPIRARAIARFHDPVGGTYTWIAEGSFRARIYCFDAKALRELFRYLVRNNYLDREEAAEIGAPGE